MHRQTGLATPALPPDRPAPGDARYHRAGDPWPLYASLEPQTAWAEWAAATGAAVDPATERRRLWPLDVRDLAILDLRRAEAREALGIEPDALVGSWDDAHGAAARAHAMGAQGMVVPSAARPGAWNLVVFPTGFDRVTVRRGRAMHPRPPSVSRPEGGG